jgi:hypothetical protein
MPKQYVAFPLPSPYSFDCPHYTNNGKTETVKAVIVPTTFNQKDVFSWQIGWSCNFCRKCQKSECVYSYAAYQKQRET